MKYPTNSSDEKNHSDVFVQNKSVGDMLSIKLDQPLPLSQQVPNKISLLAACQNTHSHTGCKSCDSDCMLGEVRTNSGPRSGADPRACVLPVSKDEDATSVIFSSTNTQTYPPSPLLQGLDALCLGVDKTNVDCLHHSVSTSSSPPHSSLSSTSNRCSSDDSLLFGAQDYLAFKCNNNSSRLPTTSSSKNNNIPTSLTTHSVLSSYKLRWGIPSMCRLVGGAESATWNTQGPAAGNGSGAWGQAGQAPPPPSGWNNPGGGAVVPPSSSGQNPSQSAVNASHSNPGGQLKGAQPPQGGANPNNAVRAGANSLPLPPGSNQNVGAKNQGEGGGGGATSWAQAAGKNLPPQPPSNNAGGAGAGNNPVQSNVGGVGGPASNSSKQQLEQLSTMREALYAQDGWGGQHVNQDSSWDIPGSPEPPNKEPSNAGGGGGGSAANPAAPVWKPNVNNGTELWEANLRNGGQPPPQVQQKTPWGHTPATNIGGTWGEDDESDSPNLWSGVPAGPAGWGAAPNANQGPVWTGGPKKEEWAASANANWGDPRDPRSAAGIDPDPHINMRPGPGALGADPLLRGDPRGISGRLNGAAAAADPMWAQPPQGPPGPGPHHHIQPPGPPPVQTKMIPPGPTPPGSGAGANKVTHWKEMPTPPNMTGRGVMQGPPGGPGSLQPNPRMPPVNPGVLKPDGTPVWGPSRNGIWDGSHDPSAGVPWGNHDDKVNAPWNDGPSWGAPKAKNPNQPWLDGEVDPSSWAQPPKTGPKLTKDMVWASKQFRMLSEMGFKKEDVENALRTTNMNLEDAHDHLNALREWPSKRFDSVGGGDMPFDHGQPNSFRQTSTHNFAQSVPGNHQQMNRNSQNQQQHQQQQQPSAHQLRTLVQQIQMAVQAGYLNHQILNQPLAPQTLHLLNQLLQQIKLLHQLNQQHSLIQVNGLQGKGGNLTMIQLQLQINKAKQLISNLQNQISSQQAIYVKQQTDQQYKVHDPISSLHSSFSDMGLKDPCAQDGFPGGHSGSSRLNQWKLPSLDKDSENEFSRAPGTTSKSTPGSTSPLTNPLLGQSDGTWSSVTRSDTGWPDSDPNKDWPSSQSNQQGPAFTTDLVPEFEPGKPWKGTMKNIEDDPSITPGSVVRSPISLATLKDTEIFTSSASINSGGGKTSPSNPDMSSVPPLSLSNSTWSFNPPASSSSFTSPLGKLGTTSKTVWGDSAPLPSAGSNDLWGTPKPRGPPPGMAGKPGPVGNSASNGWSSRPGGGSTWGAPQTNSGWSAGTWVLLKNLTPQIDGSTLKTLCVQHGPLQNFHLYLNHSIALVKYSTREEAIKAQGHLNNCVLGNTTIFAESPSDAEVQQLLQHLSVANANSNNNNGPGVGGWSRGGGGNANKDTWSTGGATPSQLWGPSNPSSSSGSLWGAPPLDSVDRSTPSSLNSFLPGDLLGGESM